MITSRTKSQRAWINYFMEQIFKMHLISADTALNTGLGTGQRWGMQGRSEST